MLTMNVAPNAARLNSVGVKFMSIKSFLLKSAGAAALGLAGASAASADVVVLNFEDIAPYPNSNDVAVLDYYNGGTSSIGTSGTDYGVNIGSNGVVICLNTPGVTCSNTSRGGLAPGSEEGGLFFLEGSETYMNVAAGFDTGFSFYYSAPNTPGSVVVYDGLNGTGNVLAVLDLTLTPSTCGSEYSAAYCPFVAAGIDFDGIAQSVAFGGVANYIVFDDITFGSSTPGNPGVPEPATWAMMIGGFGLAGAAMRTRRKAVVA